MAPELSDRIDRLVHDLQARSVELPPTRRRRAIREGAGASLREVAETLGVAVMTVHGWEHGSTPKPDRASAYALLLDRLAEAGS
jgi:DNA-binding transcriptional regulator YiaG